MRARIELIQCKVELEYIDSGFTEEAELPRDNVCDYEAADCGFGEMPFLGDPRDLVQRGGGRDVRVKTRCRCGNEIDRHGRAGRGLQCLN